MPERISDERARELGERYAKRFGDELPIPKVVVRDLLADRADLKAENARLTWKLEAVRKACQESGMYVSAVNVLAALDSEPPKEE